VAPVHGRTTTCPWPELPEVEVLVRYLEPALKQQTICAVIVRRGQVIAPTSLCRFQRTLMGAQFEGLTRRGKYLIFKLRTAARQPITCSGTWDDGRMYLNPGMGSCPGMRRGVLLDRKQFVYEDTRILAA